MNLPRQEQVLCAPATLLPQHWLPEAGAVPLTESALLSALLPIPPVWLERPLAESDAEFKQFIPYALVLNPRGELAAYPRKGGENRLHGLWSVGVGGHVNPADAAPSLDGRTHWPSVLWRGLHRELMEEYPAVADAPCRFLGLIHEDRSPVGRVHLGLVFLLELESAAPSPAGELQGLRWTPVCQIRTGEWPWDRFELWSRLALRLLPGTPAP